MKIVKSFLLLILLGFVLFPTTKVCATQSLIAHWKFDDGSGTAPVDSSGNSITAAFTSPNPTWSTNVPSVSFSDPYSLDFTGNHDGVTVSWPSGLNFAATDPRTFSFWYKPVANGETDGTQDRIISWTSDQFEISGTDGSNSTHKIAYYDGNWHSTNITLTLGTWYHITFTYDGTTAKFYIGDELQDSHALAGRALSGTMGIGTRVASLNEGINGNIDDVRVYNYALNSTQIANLTAGSNNPDSAPDTTPPSISAIASSTSSTGATVTWTTDEVASTKVVYSADTSYASTTNETDTSTRVTSHSKSISNLVSCTTYNFKVVSSDTAHNYATSSASTFTTTCSGNATPSSITSSSVTVSSAATSTLTDSGRTITVAFPANFTSTTSSVVIQIKGLNSSTVLGSIGKPTSSLSSASSIVFDVTALIDSITTLDSFASAVTISYVYTDSDISGINESSLRMYHYHNSAWSELDSCSVNTSSNTITCTTPSFSTFAIFGTASASNSGSSSVSGMSLPWCSGPSAPGWNSNLHDGGCGKTISTTGTYPTNIITKYEFTRNLNVGIVGDDVKKLQQYLNAHGFVLVPTGLGSPGNETNKFGILTKEALIKFQKANNISPALGFFGPITRTFLNAK